MGRRGGERGRRAHSLSELALRPLPAEPEVGVVDASLLLHVLQLTERTCAASVLSPLLLQPARRPSRARARGQLTLLAETPRKPRAVRHVVRRQGVLERAVGLIALSCHNEMGQRLRARPRVPLGPWRGRTVFAEEELAGGHLVLVELVQVVAHLPARTATASWLRVSPVAAAPSV